MKTCSRCKESKSLEDFAWKDKKINKRQYACRECMKPDKYTPEQLQKRKDFLENWIKTGVRRKTRVKYNQSQIGKNKQRLYSRTRRARKNKVKEFYSIADQDYTFKIFENKCFNCGNPKQLEIDHHKPLSKGFGLSRTNAVILCRKCNSSKGIRNPEEFYTKEQIQLLEESYNILT